MTLERLQHCLPFMNALVEGKKVQWKFKHCGAWTDIPLDSFVDWTNQGIEFRMQPEVREFWVRPNQIHGLCWETRNIPPSHKEGWIHVREVEE